MMQPDPKSESEQRISERRRGKNSKKRTACHGAKLTRAPQDTTRHIQSDGISAETETQDTTKWRVWDTRSISYLDLDLDLDLLSPISYLLSRSPISIQSVELPEAGVSQSSGSSVHGERPRRALGTVATRRRREENLQCAARETTAMAMAIEVF
jgi:hypothetical protein